MCVVVFLKVFCAFNPPFLDGCLDARKAFLSEPMFKKKKKSHYSQRRCDILFLFLVFVFFFFFF